MNKKYRSKKFLNSEKNKVVKILGLCRISYETIKRVFNEVGALWIWMVKSDNK